MPIKHRISNPRVRKKALYRFSDDDLDQMTTGEIIRKYGHLFTDQELIDMINNNDSTEDWDFKICLN